MGKRKKHPPSKRSNKTPPNQQKTQEEIERRALLDLRAHFEGFRGPIPPPQIMKGYEEVLPGSADRIMKMAEYEQNHRHYLEKKGLGFAVFSDALGKILAFILGASGLLGSIFLLYKDKSLTGLAVLITSLGSLIGIYLYGKKQSIVKEDSE